MSPRRSRKTSFEDKMARLEAIVEELEKGGLELEKAISLFKEGTKLVEELSEMLRDAEIEIENLYSEDDLNGD